MLKTVVYSTDIFAVSEPHASSFAKFAQRKTTRKIVKKHSIFDISFFYMIYSLYINLLILL